MVRLLIVAEFDSPVAVDGDNLFRIVSIIESTGQGVGEIG